MDLVEDGSGAKHDSDSHTYYNRRSGFSEIKQRTQCEYLLKVAQRCRAPMAFAEVTRRLAETTAAPGLSLRPQESDWGGRARGKGRRPVRGTCASGAATM